MPHHASDPLPALLSQTGAFKDVRRLIPADGLVPYDVNVSFWSDGAVKQRWIALPRGSQGIHFSPTGAWQFPAGTVCVKQFNMPMDARHPDQFRRLETRLIVRDAAGGVYGATYRWRKDNSDADLVTDPQTEKLVIRTKVGARAQSWYYPGRKDCLVCHTANAGGVLGVTTRQLNRNTTNSNGRSENQLLAWSRAGMFLNPPDAAKLNRLPRLSSLNDSSVSLQIRARSWLDANCAQCHRPGGAPGNFDARFQTPLDQQHLIGGPVLINLGIDRARLVAPHDTWRSILLARVQTLEQPKMPPLAHNTIDRDAAHLLRQWIQSLPGPSVLPPPIFSPRGIDSPKPITVTLLDRDPAAEIHYTLDGSPPEKSSPIYTNPLKIDGPVTIRAAAYRQGYARSITAQETYIVGN